jgi:hypothetical protein
MSGHPDCPVVALLSNVVFFHPHFATVPLFHGTLHPGAVFHVPLLRGAMVPISVAHFPAIALIYRLAHCQRRYCTGCKSN